MQNQTLSRYICEILRQRIISSSNLLQYTIFLLSFHIIYFYPVGEVRQFVMEPVDQQPEVAKLENIIHNRLNCTDV